MNSFLLGIMPGMMAKYEYVHDLLMWAEQSVDKIKGHGSTINYPLIDSMLLAALEKASNDVGSVSLLKFVRELHSLNGRLDETNKHPDDTRGALDTFLHLKSEIPRLDGEVKVRLGRYAAKSVVFFVVVGLLVLTPHISAWIHWLAQ